jgi:ubiquinone/menaquinone biosynthesis C-methylase UbiE
MQTHELEQREAEYWDAVVQNLTLDDGVQTNEPLARRRIELLGDVAGKKVLDVGCGAGCWSVQLARSGAEVWSIDISPKSVQATSNRAAACGVGDRVHARVMSAMQMDFADGFFDIIHGQDIIHHVDADLFGAEAARVLKSGGHAVFQENCANNRLLMFARDHLCGRFGIAKWSSDDEYPLTREKLARFGRYFPQAEVFFPEFMCFFFLDAKLFRYRRPLVSRVCKGIDHAIHRIPFLRRYSYFQLIRVGNGRGHGATADTAPACEEPANHPKLPAILPARSKRTR